MGALMDRQLTALSKGLLAVGEGTSEGLGTCMDVEVLLVVLLGTKHFPALFAGEAVVGWMGSLDVATYVVLRRVHVRATRAWAFVSSAVHFIGSFSSIWLG